MGAIAEAFAAFAKPLLDQTDGSEEQLNKALQIGQLCYSLALLSDDQREGLLGEMRSAFDMNDEEFDEFRRSIVAPMIRRHEEMFPRMHGRDLADDWADDWPSGPARGAAWIVPKPRPTQSSLTQRPVDRYAPCPCNSGKKYKFCCGMKRG
ncbi:MAG TPA: SEC-C metal-binding domain-containing protein [Pirellulales bacterium]|nr:SEC-C metal-binding domain-containing protein [Pirellulales bacterium]